MARHPFSAVVFERLDLVLCGAVKFLARDILVNLGRTLAVRAVGAAQVPGVRLADRTVLGAVTAELAGAGVTAVETAARTILAITEGLAVISTAERLTITVTPTEAAGRPTLTRRTITKRLTITVTATGERLAVTVTATGAAGSPTLTRRTITKRLTITVTATGERLTITVTATGERLTITVTATGERLTITVTPTGERLTITVTPTGERLTITVTATGERLTITVTPTGTAGSPTLTRRTITKRLTITVT
ncbi:lipoprotein-anchoring transpeptidase ErfK/SrfK [Arthrobacter sp. UYEF3]